MNPDTVRRLVTEAGHADLADAAVGILQPAVALVATQLARSPNWRHDDPAGLSAVVDAFDAALAALPLGASRFGGVPDLPPDTAWPTYDGVPMEFLVQLRLDEVAPHDPLGRLPTTGSLLFFKSSQWGFNDMEPDARLCAVLYAPGPPEALRRATPPQVEWKSEYSPTPQVAPFTFGLASVATSPFLDVPASGSPFVPDALKAAWGSLRHAKRSELVAPDTHNHLLGYARDTDYVRAHVHGADDQLLLELSSDAAAEFQFGDVDTLRFILRKDELAALDFSKVRVYLNLG